jgi:hypothetical protein
MLEMAGRVNWDEYHLFLTQGTPSIGLQLLALNVMLVVYLMHRRTRKKKGKSAQTDGLLLPLLFLVGNYSVVNWGSQLSF